MKKNISTQCLKKHIGEVVDAVRLRGDRYIIERRGKAVAAIVPVSVEENDERQRQRLFSLIETIQRQNQKIPSDQINHAIEQAVNEVQDRRHKKRKPDSSA